MDKWLERAREEIAEASGVAPAELELQAATQTMLLELARIAAHESGERTNAPLLCYLIGLAQGRSGTSVEDLADAVS